VSGSTSFSTDKLMRARLIASGRLRPRNDNELDPIQLPPRTVVFRLIDSTRWLFDAYKHTRGMAAYHDRMVVRELVARHIHGECLS